MRYNEQYYKTGNYKDYLTRSDKYAGLAKDICGYLQCQPLRILDFGCGVGFLVKHLQSCHFCYGYDISEWALNYGTNELGLCLERELPQDRFDVVLFMDVLEHMKPVEICRIFDHIEADRLIVRIPVCLEDEGKFVLEVSEKDVTHITRMTKESWLAFFAKLGYSQVDYLKMDYIWDSPGVFCGCFTKC